MLEKMEKQEEENVKKIEDEKKLTEANSKSHQTELQSKQDVSVNWKSFCTINKTMLKTISNCLCIRCVFGFHNLSFVR